MQSLSWRVHPIQSRHPDLTPSHPDMAWALLAPLLVLLGLWSWIGRAPEAPTFVSHSDVPIYMRAPSQGYEPFYPNSGRRGAVTSEVDVCSNTGAFLLDKGGSAADAVRTGMALTRRSFQRPCALV